MHLSRLFSVRIWFAALAVAVAALTLSVPTTASAADFVAISGSKVNVRAQPSTNSEVLWQLVRGYPLQVEQRKGSWIKVRDFEASLGWVAAQLVNKTPHRVVKSSTLNLRSQPTTSSKVVGKLHQYDVLRTLGTKGNWAHVQAASGATGWVASNLTWGW